VSRQWSLHREQRLLYQRRLPGERDVLRLSQLQQRQRAAQPVSRPTPAAWTEIATRPPPPLAPTALWRSFLRCLPIARRRARSRQRHPDRNQLICHLRAPAASGVCRTARFL